MASRHSNHMCQWRTLRPGGGEGVITSYRGMLRPSGMWSTEWRRWCIRDGQGRRVRRDRGGAATSILDKPLRVQRHAVLLYQITLDNELKLVPPEDEIQKPSGASLRFRRIFCVLRTRRRTLGARKRPFLSTRRYGVQGHITTHDVLTYSAKARKHKQVYPYLRYG